MSHTRDVESGAIFRRFEEMMRTVPVEGTIHLDNMRITNCDPRSDPEGIGILEELVCGLMPIVDWLRERGISVSTEGYNGLPADPAPVVSAFRHHDPRDSARQISWSASTSARCSTCSICSMRCWRGTKRTAACACGSAGGVRAEVCGGGRDRLSATWDEVVAADGRDRFVPLGDGVYCYSRHGCRRAWLLPPALRGRPLELFTLSAAGRGAAPEHGLRGDLLTLTLAPRVPVKIVAAEGA